MKKLLWPLFLICLLAFPVAANNVPNLGKSGSIHISMRYDGSAVSGGEFVLYRVGEIQESDGNYSFRLVDPFASSEVTLENVHAFDANIVSNTYENDKGVITFDGPITLIGESAFYGCNKLSKVTVNSTKITYVGKSAFKKCSTNLTIKVPKNKKKAYQKLWKGKGGTVK